MKHIILCGSRGVGKSTLIRRLLRETELPVYGFVTVKGRPDETGEHATHIYPASLPAERRVPSVKNLVGKCGSGHLTAVYPEVFNREGCRCLDDYPERGILVMDELGFMENEAYGFQRAVYEHLKAAVPVIAAVKDKETAFLTAVRSWPNCQVYEITEENRDGMFRLLAPLVRRL